MHAKIAVRYYKCVNIHTYQYIYKHITVTMAKVLFFLALLVAAASAFVAPVQHAGMYNVIIASHLIDMFADDYHF
jgi:hypothetical protein